MSLDLTALSLGSNYAVPQSSYLVEDNGTWPSCDPAISNITVHFTCLNNIPQDIFNLDVKLRVKPNITQTTSQVINLTAAQLRGVDTHPSEIKWHRQRVDYKSQSSLFSKRSRDYINNVWYPVDTALVRQVCGAAAFRVDDE